MPTRRHSSSTPPRAGVAQRPALRQRINEILTRRDRLVSELAVLRERHGSSSPSLDKALTLLTRWWSGADWNGREELLNAADWLVRLEKIRGRDLQPST